MAPAYAVAAILQRHRPDACRTSTTTRSTRRSPPCRCACSRPGSRPTTVAIGWAATRALGSIDTSKLNVKGGSVAIGHPFAATGARILATLAKLLADDSSGQARPRLGLHRRRHGRDRDPGACVSQFETLMARDGHTFSTYIAKPAGKARGGVVIVQEIFGLTPHIRARGRQLCAAGLPGGAPALVRPRRVASSCSATRRRKSNRPWVTASRSRPPRRCWTSPPLPRSAATPASVAVIGFCWGGTPRLGCGQRAAAGRRGLLLRRRNRSRSCRRRRPARRCCTSANTIAASRSATVERCVRPTRQAIYHLYAAGPCFQQRRSARITTMPQPAALARARTSAFLAQHIG